MSRPLLSSQLSYRLLLLFVLGWMLLHVPLLSLPYHWDEAGYFVPAAYDLFRTGDPIPRSEPSNAHPPLVMAVVALSWKLFGFTPAVARTAVLFLGALALLGAFRLAAHLANRQVAFASVICTAFYPVFFVQSTLVHLDLAATAFSLWGLAFYFERRVWSCAAMFSLAALTKETAILTPIVLAAWELFTCLTARSWWSTCPHFSRAWTRNLAALALPILPLGLWFAYHGLRTGSALGNPEFLDYNMASTMDPVRMLVVLPMRFWHVTVYMNLFVLSLLAVAVTLCCSAVRDGPEERQGISARPHRVLLVLILAHLVAFSLFGGAVLPRYMLPVIPLVILICVTVLWRRLRHWRFTVGIATSAFIVGLFVCPTYQFDRGDNLAYRDFVLLQRSAARFVAESYPEAVVSTAWPATEGLRKPYLGYAEHPVQVASMKDFSPLSLAATRHSGSDIAVVFSRRQKPSADRYLRRLALVEDIRSRFFERLDNVSLDEATRLVGDRILWQKENGGNWIVIVELDTNYSR